MNHKEESDGMYHDAVCASLKSALATYIKLLDQNAPEEVLDRWQDKIIEYARILKKIEVIIESPYVN